MPAPTPDDVATLIAELQRADSDLPSMVYAATGCRRGELCGLRWSDLDHEAATLTARRSITDTTARVAEKAARPTGPAASPSGP